MVSERDKLRRTEISSLYNDTLVSVFIFTLATLVLHIRLTLVDLTEPLDLVSQTQIISGPLPALLSCRRATTAFTYRTESEIFSYILLLFPFLTL